MWGFLGRVNCQSPVKWRFRRNESFVCTWFNLMYRCTSDIILHRSLLFGLIYLSSGNATWVFFGIIVALTFTLLGWHNWSVLPPSHTSTLLIILNLLTILTSTLILHLGFFGRLLSLYKRNFQRVEFITSCLHNLQGQWQRVCSEIVSNYICDGCVHV